MYRANLRQYWREHLAHLAVGFLIGLTFCIPLAMLVCKRQDLEYQKRNDTPGIDMALSRDRRRNIWDYLLGVPGVAVTPMIDPTGMDAVVAILVFLGCLCRVILDMRIVAEMKMTPTGIRLLVVIGVVLLLIMCS